MLAGGAELELGCQEEGRGRSCQPRPPILPLSCPRQDRSKASATGSQKPERPTAWHSSTVPHSVPPTVQGLPAGEVVPVVVPHRPSEQVWPVAQRLLQNPQLALSLCTSVHTPRHLTPWS